MTGAEDVLDAIAGFHEDVPHRFQVSLTMSLDVRDDVRAVRNELNDVAGERAVTTNDVMRLALVAAARYHSLATAEDADLTDVDRDLLVPLTAAIGRVIDDERVLDGSGSGSDGSGSDGPDGPDGSDGSPAAGTSE